jgi:bifunctional UDP-N-acetylglucosamine pyrophosphorylase/glucosamine-1-phosphate N-acetyltransferase
MMFALNIFFAIPQRVETLKASVKTASIILAAGRGSRMKDFDGNKTLLPLVPGKTHYEGSHPILLQILKSLPHGPKALVVNHQKKAVIEATQGLHLVYCEQAELNGTGGGLLAASSFLERQDCDHFIITMGDVPFVKDATYRGLVKELRKNRLVVLGFIPESKKQYGVLEIEGSQVRKIIEWKYWSKYTQEKQQTLTICNAGIYAARKKDLLRYLMVLASRPHRIQKQIDGELREVKEYFITDLVEYMQNDGLPVGFVISEDENEVMGVDDFPALTKAQKIYKTLAV